MGVWHYNLHFFGGSPCMVISGNGSGAEASSPLGKVSAKGSARHLIQKLATLCSGLFYCAKLSVGVAAQRHVLNYSELNSNYYRVANSLMY